MTKEEKKKTNLSIRIRPVCILMFLPLWTKYTCLLYHCQKETVVWQKKYGLFYAYTHTIVDIGKNSWKIDIPIMSVYLPRYSWNPGYQFNQSYNLLSTDYMVSGKVIHTLNILCWCAKKPTFKRNQKQLCKESAKRT